MKSNMKLFSCITLYVLFMLAVAAVPSFGQSSISIQSSGGGSSCSSSCSSSGGDCSQSITQTINGKTTTISNQGSCSSGETISQTSTQTIDDATDGLSTLNSASSSSGGGSGISITVNGKTININQTMGSMISIVISANSSGCSGQGISISISNSGGISTGSSGDSSDESVVIDDSADEPIDTGDGEVVISDPEKTNVDPETYIGGSPKTEGTSSSSSNEAEGGESSGTSSVDTSGSIPLEGFSSSDAQKVNAFLAKLPASFKKYAGKIVCADSFPTPQGGSASSPGCTHSGDLSIPSVVYLPTWCFSDSNTNLPVGYLAHELSHTFFKRNPKVLSAMGMGEESACEAVGNYCALGAKSKNGIASYDVIKNQMMNGIEF